MSYHIIIAQERRAPPRDTSIPVVDQLHTMAESIGAGYLTDPQILMVAEWDQRSPYVVQLKGDYSTAKMRFSGWPEVIEADYVPPTPSGPVIQ